QRQAHDHLEGAWAQDKPDAGCREDADRTGEDQFHQLSPFSTASTVGAGATFARPNLEARGERTDWCASGMRISTVAPTTSMKTPRSKSRAEASGTLPIHGISTYWKAVVRNG